MGDFFGSSSSSDSEDRLTDAYTRGYNEYADHGYLTKDSDWYVASDLSDAYLMGNNQYYKDQQALQAFSFPEIDLEGMMSSYSEALEQQRLAAEKAQGLADRDTYYGGRMDAAEASISFVNGQIAEEKANAALFGLDYEITADQKQQRVDDYFASVWSASDEEQLNALMDKYGAPKGHEEFIVNRGDSTSYESSPGKSDTVSVSKGYKPKAKTDDDEDSLGGSNTILGGAN